MADLAAELLRRNARFRAWRAYGLPVEGGWGLSEAGALLILQLDCSACHTRTSGCWDKSAFTLPVLLYQERYEVEHHYRQTGCTHLVELLGEDPPAVVELIALELLA